MTQIKPILAMTSLGLKSGWPIDKPDLLIDCRAIPNPHRALGALRGADPEVINWCITYASPFLNAVDEIIKSAIATMPERRRTEANPYARPIRIAFMCAYGVHRSVATKLIMAERYRYRGYTVNVP